MPYYYSVNKMFYTASNEQVKTSRKKKRKINIFFVFQKIELENFIKSHDCYEMNDINIG